MTNTIIFATTALTSILLLGTSIVQAADHGDAPLISNDQGADISDMKAIPGWVDNNFKWYGEGKISQSDLLNGIKHLMDNNLMHISDKAAQEVSDLRTENAALKKKLSVDGMVGPNTGSTSGIPSHSPEWTDSNDSDPGVMRPGDEIMIILYPSPGASTQPGDEIMVLLRPSPGSSMQPGDELMILLRPAPGAADNDYSFVGSTNAHTADAAHEKWIDVLSIDMASHRAGAPDSFFDIWIEPEASADDTSRTITFTGLESASETVYDLVNNGETSTTGWEEGVAAFTSKNYGTSSASTTAHELLHSLGMMDNAIEKEIQKIQTELDILEELHDKKSGETTERSGSSTQYEETDFEFIQRHAAKIDAKISSLQAGLDVLNNHLVADSFSFGVEREMKESGEKGGTEDINIGIGELQESIEKQQQTLQMMSNISKSLQETQTATLRIG